MSIHSQNKNGFTLVEMIVSIGLFTIALFIASSAFLAVLNADRKSRATRIAIDNLNLSLEDMSRRIKTGAAYQCMGILAITTGANTADCTAPGGTSIIFTEQDGTTRTKYELVGNSIRRTVGIGTTLNATAPEITINNLRFVVGGTAGNPDTLQPYVIILVDGVTNIGAVASSFRIQTMVTQRGYDI